VNAAARLEAANKQLGSSICVGPEAAGRCDATMLRPLGTISVQGRDEPLAVFEPWPSAASAEWRERYMAAFGLVARDPKRAAALFDELSLEAEADPVARGMAQRLRAAAVPSYA
jgi:adenylate cyclase